MKKFLLIALGALALATPARAQVRLSLDVNDTIKSTFFTEANSDTIVDGLNANVTQGKQFAARLIPGGGGGSGVFVGTQSGGVHLSWGSTEQFAGQTCEVTVQTYGTMNGIMIHSTGTGGIALVAQSDTGAPAVKALQMNHFDNAASIVWRNGPTLSVAGDAPGMIVHDLGAADKLHIDTANGPTGINGPGGFQPIHIADTVAYNDSYYYSTTSNGMAYKDANGVITHYGATAPLNTLNVLNYSPTIRGRTGGGTTNLDGVATVGLPSYYCLTFYMPANGLEMYVLEPDTVDATGTYSVTPLDHNSTTNARSWRQRL